MPIMLVLVDGIKVGSRLGGLVPGIFLPRKSSASKSCADRAPAVRFGSHRRDSDFTRKGGGALMPSASFTAGSYGTYNRRWV
jgi:hypothetical protein